MKLVLYAQLRAKKVSLQLRNSSIDVLPANFWGGETRQPELLAAFVKPNGVYVESLVKQVTESSRKTGAGTQCGRVSVDRLERKPYLMAGMFVERRFFPATSLCQPATWIRKKWAESAATSRHKHHRSMAALP